MSRQFSGAFVIVILSVVSLFAADWGVFRGPTGAGSRLFPAWEGGVRIEIDDQIGV